MKSSKLYVLVIVILLSTLAFACDSSDDDPSDGDQELAMEDDDGESDQIPEDGDSDGDMDIEITEETEQEADEPWPDEFYFGVIADTHIIDEFYTGSEENIYNTSTNLEVVRDKLNAIEPELDFILLAGDAFHNYPSDDWEFFMDNDTRVDNLKGILDGFEMPVYISLGNHDYDVPDVTREFTERLVKEKLDLELYYSFEHYGWKFVALNNFLGDTFNMDSPKFNTTIGSFGREQLNWLESQLAEGKPTITFFHYPLVLISNDELPDTSLKQVLSSFDNHLLALAGHWHRWMDFETMLGVNHIAVSSSRFDDDAYMVFKADTKTGSYEILNYDCYVWDSAETHPYDPVNGCTPPEE